jgi:hypothetical protein
MELPLVLMAAPLDISLCTLLLLQDGQVIFSESCLAIAKTSNVVWQSRHWYSKMGITVDLLQLHYASSRCKSHSGTAPDRSSGQHANAETFSFQERIKNIALLAHFKFVMFTGILGAIAESSAKKPAKVATLKLPGRALLFQIALFSVPAWGEDIVSAPLIDQQEIQLSLNMRWNRSPPLFITVNGFQRHSQKFGQLLLCLCQFFSRQTEFFFCQQYTFKLEFF